MYLRARCLFGMVTAVVIAYIIQGTVAPVAIDSVGGSR